jgi:hypothetical protein
MSEERKTRLWEDARIEVFVDEDKITVELPSAVASRQAWPA